MKVGIITIHNSPNYGACLQSFALYEYLSQTGYDVEIIDLHRPYHADYRPSRRFRPYTRQHNEKEQCFRAWLGRIRRNLLQKITKRKITHQPQTATNSVAIQKFDSFNSQIRLSKPYYGIDELYENPPQYDVYITGSDQVWNPTQSYCLEPYFLTFVRKGRRVSYASSIGIEQLTSRERKDFRHWLDKYDAISVREKQAQELLQTISAKTIEQVADPTFLLDYEYWKNLSIEPVERNYILLFMLSFNKDLFEYGKRLAKESGKKLMVLDHVFPFDSDGSFTIVYDAGPQEFIGYIACADVVITDSFHCTVFSIIMGAHNFYTYIAPWNKRGSRIVDLLNTFHLEKHLLNSSLNQSMSELELETIDRINIMKVYESEQEKSRRFLKENL